MDGEQEAEAEDDDGVDPSLKNTQLSKEQKVAFTQGLGDWDSKFTEMFEKKNQDLEAMIPAKKK